jgi:hypothetical protein
MKLLTQSIRHKFLVMIHLGLGMKSDLSLKNSRRHDTNWHEISCYVSTCLFSLSARESGTGDSQLITVWRRTGEVSELRGIAWCPADIKPRPVR